jgi:hypothetical protein
MTMIGITKKFLESFRGCLQQMTDVTEKIIGSADCTNDIVTITLPFKVDESGLKILLVLITLYLGGRGSSQKEMARVLGVNQTSISKILSSAAFSSKSYNRIRQLSGNKVPPQLLQLLGQYTLNGKSIQW